MPSAEKSQSLDRLLALLALIPVGRLSTTSELLNALAGQGIEVEARTVQRDLRMLQQHFAIECDERSKPHGWRWTSAGARDSLLGLSAPEALGLVLLERHLRHALPASWSSSLNALFQQARTALEKTGPRGRATRWVSKVHVAPPGLGQLPAELPPAAVLEAVSEALLNEHQLQLSYRKPGTQEEQSYLLHPVGLLLRGPTVYLAAVTDADRTGPVRHFALHRITAALALPKLSALPVGLDMAAAMKRSGGLFGTESGGELIDLCFRCDRVLADLLCEAPLDASQHVETLTPDWYEVRVRLPLSWELRWWLLAHIAQLEVLAPANLREEVRQKLEAGLLRHLPAQVAHPS
ncbi:helix-turn-helix transcriptional regulator [Roseateles sp. BYS87W]|uniref:Helix-turn-helix transcriptional regulator n=1 Tax=Pelomonas baiyunensis TaxID=3299026 RepID=A0ABW7H2F1_9BURK